ncbi:MAG: hypothetical protein R6U39_04485 [Candidatus Aegiribacteria sp.]
MSYTEPGHPSPLPFRCRNCGNDLEGLPTDVIFYCWHCGRCWGLEQDFSPLGIDFMRMGGEGTVPLPFWKVDVTVSIYRRMSRRESSPSMVRGFREFTGGERGLSDHEPETRRDRLIFPAFSTSLVLSTGVRMHRENFLPERLEHGSSARVFGGSVGLPDARTLARGVAVGVEVSRKDFLACVDLDVEVSSASIYAVGCTQEEHLMRINGSRIALPFSAVRDCGEILRMNSRT